MAYLHVITGPMFSSKTSTLISVIQKHTVLGRSVLVLTHELDNRSGKSDQEVIRTHEGQIHPAWKHMELSKLDRTVAVQYDVIAIDEGQFFPDLVEQVTSWLRMGKIVIVAGLIGDWAQRPFGDIMGLFPLADEVQHLRALCLDCKDGTAAPFTTRLPGKRSDTVVDPGGKETYKAVCRKHLVDNNKIIFNYKYDNDESTSKRTPNNG